jgi:hypothetical protein
MENKEPEKDFIFEIFDPFPPYYIPMPDALVLSDKKRDQETGS